MSGPLRADDVVESGEAVVAPSGATVRGPSASAVEITPSREAQIGDAVVRRSLPTRLRRTVGAWCFLDHAPAASVDGGHGMQIGPHPHMGLQTVTWLLAGDVVHRDSLGSEQLIRPGQLNLMTAGRGVVHAEETPAGYRGAQHAVQLWVAQPEATRNADAAFEHHESLPRLDVGNAVGTVLVGTVGDVTSPARRDTDPVGVDLVLRAGVTSVPVDPAHEHAVVVLDGALAIGSQVVEPDVLAYLAPGRDSIPLVTNGWARALVIGGTPFEARPFMWWNFVARTRDEIDEAYDAWQSGDDRFGPVASTLALVPAPPPPWRTSAGPFRPD